MELYLLHHEPHAEPDLAPLASQLDCNIQSVASLRELTDCARLRSSTHCLVTSVLPGKDCALDFLPQLKRQFPDLPVIVWSSNLDVPTGVELMRRGAFSVLEYPCSQPKLLLTLHQAIHESQRLRGRVLRERELRSKLNQLSDGERQVMRMLFDGMTNKEIAARLTVSRRTIETRRQRIVRLTGVSNLIHLVVLLAEHDLLESSRPSPEPLRQGFSPERWLQRALSVDE